MLQAFDYLKSGVLEPWRYHGVLFGVMLQLIG